MEKMKIESVAIVVIPFWKKVIMRFKPRHTILVEADHTVLVYKEVFGHKYVVDAFQNPERKKTN